MNKGLFLCLLLTLAGCEFERTYDGRTPAAWRKDLKSPDRTARWRAVMILTQAGDKELRKALPDVTELLDDDDPRVRRQAIQALIQLDGKKAVPQLVKMLRDPEPSVRDWAGQTLKTLDQEAAERAGVN